MDTERLYLREVELADLDRLYEIYSGEGITDYMEGLYENRFDEEIFTQAYIKNMYCFYGYGIWAVCLKENDRVIGRAGLSNREVDGINRLELGYVIDVLYQHQNYAYEACQAICTFAKEELLENQIVCFIEKDNAASIKLAERLGFEFQKYTASEAGNTEKIFAYYRKVL